MIDTSELREWAQRFGVSTAQIRRDHFISHVLHAVAGRYPSTRFFGGTALCRTYLDQTRLSEDIDLLDREPLEFLTTLRDELPRAIRREFPDATWSTALRDGDGVASSLTAPNVDAIKIYAGQDGPDTAAWEYSATSVRLRYRDLPSDDVFQCPTAPTFAAMKLAAWSDRQAPRDLFDLAGLANLGILHDRGVARIFKRATGTPIIMADFSHAPSHTAAAWETELGAQVGALPSVDTCLETVRAALAAR